MILALKVPYGVGDLAPEVTYPHVYITTFYVNGPGQVATITYEVGTMSPPTNDAPMGTWARASLVPTFTLQIAGADLYPFFTTQVQEPKPEDDTTTPPTPAVSGALWDQVEALLYAQIQASDARLAGAFI